MAGRPWRPLPPRTSTSPPPLEGADSSQMSASQGPSSADAEKSRFWGIGGKVKFQTFMQKSFTCKAHLQILPPHVLFPYYIFPSATQVSSSSFFYVVHLLPVAHCWLASSVTPPPTPGTGASGQVRRSAQLLTLAPGSSVLRIRRRGLGTQLLGHHSGRPLRALSLRLLLRPSGSWEPMQQTVPAVPTPPLSGGKQPAADLLSSLRPGIGMSSFTRPGCRRLLHKMGRVIIAALLAQGIRSAA